MNQIKPLGEFSDEEIHGKLVVAPGRHMNVRATGSKGREYIGNVVDGVVVKVHRDMKRFPGDCSMASYVSISPKHPLRAEAERALLDRLSIRVWS